MKKYSKKKILLLSISGGILICLISIYLYRNTLLQSIVSKHTARIEQVHRLNIHYEKMEMKGLNKIILQQLSIVPKQRDTLLTLKSAMIKLSFWKLLTREIEIRHVTVNDLSLTFIKQDSIANYDFLFKKGKEQLPQVTVNEANYSERINKLLNLCFGFLPENGKLNHICITEQKNKNFVSITLPSFIIKENHFQSDINIQEDTLSQYWIANGEIKQDDNTLKINLYSSDPKKISLPYIWSRSHI